MPESETNHFYTRAELIAAHGTAPIRGLYCKKCSTYIPQFAEISEADKQRVLRLANGGRAWMAIAELMDATGCDLGWAKVWVGHRGKPEVVYETPCPFCGQVLRSSGALQCRHCKRDWHDPGNVRVLGTSNPFPKTDSRDI